MCKDVKNLGFYKVNHVFLIGTKAIPMKRLLFFLILFTSSGVIAQQTAVPGSKELLSTVKDAHDFGKIPQGKPVTTYFELTNTGKTPLVLENVQASCGCTTPEWSKAPIEPGTSTKIKVGYNAAAEGFFQKTITVQYNGNSVKQLTITGTVYKAAPASAPANPSVVILQQVKEN